MEEITMKVYLPSRGKFNPAHAEPIVLDMMGFEEEKIAFGSSTEEALDEVLKRCIKSPENFDVTELTPEDRRFLMYKLRIHSYGDEYHVRYKENGEYVETKISMDDIEVVELPDNFEIPGGKLPMNGSDIRIKVLTTGEIRKINNYCREKADKLGLNYSELRVEAMMAKRIDTVNGEALDTKDAIQFLKGLKGRDLAFIDYLINKIDYGYRDTVKVTTKTGNVIDVPFRMTGEFFRPRFDD